MGRETFVRNGKLWGDLGSRGQEKLVGTIIIGNLHDHNSKFENLKLYKKKKREKRSKKVKSRRGREFLAVRDRLQKIAKNENMKRRPEKE